MRENVAKADLTLLPDVETMSVSFIITPFFPPERPALGVSSLKATLKQQLVPADILYLNLHYRRYLASLLGEPLPNLFGKAFYLLGEMLFTKSLWQEKAPSWEAYQQRYLQEQQSDFPTPSAHLTGTENQRLRYRSLAEKMMLGRLHQAYNETPAIVRAWANDILQTEPEVVGFSIAAQQTVAALALARELKKQGGNAPPKILFGGCGCAGEIGRAIADNFPFVDLVIAGESETEIGSIITSLRTSTTNIDRYQTIGPVSDLATLPLPDYTDYFQALEKIPGFPKKQTLIAETSRGCYRGQRQHCKFCSRPAAGMQFRLKPKAKVTTEILELSDNYRCDTILMADSILAPQVLSDHNRSDVTHDLHLMYNAGTDLSREQLEKLPAAGVTWLQAGVEQLNSELLNLLGKGTSRLQNLQFLKWCRELRLTVIWHLLFGIPGEQKSHYDELIELVPAICHLAPPVDCSQIQLMRGSPFWQEPERYGFTNVRRFWSYDFIYAGLPEDERERLAFYFNFSYRDEHNPTAYLANLLPQLDFWHKAEKRGAVLYFEETDTGGRIYDSRPSTETEVAILDHTEAGVLRSLDGISPRQELAKLPLAAAQLSGILTRFSQARWVIEETDHLLSLVTRKR